MAYVVYSQKRGVIGYCEGSSLDASLRDDETAIPCEKGADMNDKARWMNAANDMKENGSAAPTVELAREVKREALMRTRDAIVEQGFRYGGRVYPIGPDIQTTLLMQFTASQALPAPSYAWKDIDGIYRDIGDAAAFQAFCTAAMLYGQSLFAREEMLQMLVNRAETVGEVEAITWDTVPEEEI